MKINIPTLELLLSSGINIPVAGKGVRWSKKSLGTQANQGGVYLHHSNGVIIYVGKATSGKFGTFGERMRREFHESSASNNYLHQFISNYKDEIRTTFLNFEEIDTIVDGEEIEFSKERKALILEQVLIGLYEPAGNRI